jgi:hypothetical protein
MDSCVTKSVSSSRPDWGTSSGYPTTLPWPWFFKRNSDCRIYQYLTAQDIILLIFADNGLSDFEMRLSGSNTESGSKAKALTLGLGCQVSVGRAISAGDELSIAVSEASLVRKAHDKIQIKGVKVETMGSDCIKLASPSINNN